MKTLKFFAVFAVFAAMLSITGFAQDLDTLNAQISARVGTLDAMKKQQVVGENNAGLLTAFGASGEQQAIIDAENADRTQVYALIAAKSGSTAAAVAKARADQIRGNSTGGVKVQLPSGQWVVK